VDSIEVDVDRPRADRLAVSYRVTGIMSDIRMPALIASRRSDELWRHTCFEAFIRAPSNGRYYEFNFSPSTQWAAYRFGGYRCGMMVADEIAAPSIEVESSADSYTLRTSLELDRLSDMLGPGAWRLGLSALIEDTSGLKSYWALAHPPGKPDFHHDDSFTQVLDPVMQS
jgi:hypothetical protein